MEEKIFYLNIAYASEIKTYKTDEPIKCAYSW